MKKQPGDSGTCAVGRIPERKRVDARLRGRGLRQLPGLASQDCQGSVRDRLCLPDRFWAFARELCNTAAAGKVGASGASHLMRPQGATATLGPKGRQT